MIAGILVCIAALFVMGFLSIIAPIATSLSLLGLVVCLFVFPPGAIICGILVIFFGAIQAGAQNVNVFRW